MKISRAVGAAALSVAVAASVAAPAVALTSGAQSGAPSTQTAAFPPAVTAPKPMPPIPACADLAKRLVARLPGISGDLTAVPPRPDAATTLITSAITDVTALQQAGCLPNVPGRNVKPPSPECVSDVAKLLAGLFSLVSDLSGMPDVSGAVTAAGSLVVDVSGLVSAKCLPPVKVPAAPSRTPTPTGTPTVPKLAGGPPLPTPSVPVPTPSVPKVPVPTPSVPAPVPTPSVPKLPVPVPSKPGLPSLPDNPSLPGLPTLPQLPGASNFPTAPITSTPTTPPAKPSTTPPPKK